MGLAEFERKKNEKIDGVIYGMPPAPGYQHGIANGNIYAMIKNGLRNSRPFLHFSYNFLNTFLKIFGIMSADIIRAQ